MITRAPNTANTIKERLFALLETVLKSGSFNPAFHPMIINLARSFLAKATDEELKQGITQLQEKLIPWVLNGDNQDENKNQQ